MPDLRSLSVQAMVQLSKPWLDSEGLRPRLASLPGGSALIAHAERAYRDLLAMQPKERDEVSEELRALREEESELDSLHDRSIRGLYETLTGLAELAQEEEERASLLVARSELFPEGLRATQRSYVEEAGEIELAGARLSEETVELLQALIVPGGSLWDAVGRWFDAGRALGALEERRRVLEETETSGRPSRVDVLRARNRWIRLVRHIESTLELSDASAETERAILGPVMRAAERAASGAAPDQEEEAEEALADGPEDEQDSFADDEEE